jgi:hypothetical protein
VPGLRGAAGLSVLAHLEELQERGLAGIVRTESDPRYALLSAS